MTNRLRHRIRWPVARLVLPALVLVGCSTGPVSPPSNPHNACDMFDQYPHWLEAARKSEKKYGTPVPISMAFVYQESQFVADNQPARNWIGFRPSTAYGYAQALDTTWNDYRRATGNSSADREDFDDTMDFIGWYNSNASRRAGIASNDAYRLYLAYHEGVQGYQRGTYKNKKWLLNTASSVQQRAQRYQAQMNSCGVGGNRSGGGEAASQTTDEDRQFWLEMMEQ
ncbi:hypothetical protein [Parathalassolituus penaei]|uniref:Transglycosylase SLT domain-containing protein n=1 Tax=Parathalassolituus penaei TaxID=2997323 RepID=A0A9X3ELD8_9GAMM|nr:hypothetical protein [Parathalassolituus penaei]MCY0966496.1 hypothetical protein [Parathalassolituus penaei]